MDYFSSLIRKLLDLFLPHRCVGCSVVGSALCASCANHLTDTAPQTCIGCSRPSRLGIPCPACRPRSMVDRLIAGSTLDDRVLRESIHTLKYRGTAELASGLGGVLVRSAIRHHGDMFGSNPLIVPVPLHPRRLRERGFNQAHLLAGRLARVAAMPLVQPLRRTKYASSQVRSGSRIQRLDNMAGAFVCDDATTVAGRDIILVDDVCTTGATLQDCARALKEAGARKVSAITLARG